MMAGLDKQSPSEARAHLHPHKGGRLTLGKIAKKLATSQRPSVGEVSLILPLPPSVNALTFNRKGGRSKTEAYDAWLNSAGVALNQQRPGRIAGTYSLVAAFARPNKSSDLANREKALSDLLVKHGVIEDDSLAESIRLYWHPNLLGVVEVVVSAA